MPIFDVRSTSPELDEARPRTAVLPIGSIEQHGRALPLATDWLQAATLDQVVKDLVGCLFEQDFRRVVLVNFHGGNFVLRSTVRDLNHFNSLAKVVMVWPWLTAAEELNAMLDTAGE